MADNESKKIISSKNSAKKQKMEYNISDFEDTDESDTELSELYPYIALKPSTLKYSYGNWIDILQWWHANEAKFPSISKIAKLVLSILASSAAS